jgi:hypothetical protein
MDKVLVVKAIQPNYNTVSGGPPIMMVGGGRSRGGPAVGRTKREMVGGLAGGLVGVAGALAGQHRSLGSLAQAMISGGAQGKALGSALGRSRLVGVGRQRQARADYDEEAKRDYARMGAEGRFDNRKYDGNEPVTPAVMRRRVQEVNQEDEAAREQAKRDNAFEERRAGAAGFKTGTQQAKDAQGMADLRARYMAEGYGDEAGFAGDMNTYTQSKPMNVKVEPSTPSAPNLDRLALEQNLMRDLNEPTQSVDPMQGVTRADGSVVPPQSLVAVSNSIAPLGENSAANEINNLEGAGDKFNQGKTMEAVTRKPLQEDEEDEEGEGEGETSLGNIQQQRMTGVVRPNTLGDIQRQRRQEGM